MHGTVLVLIASNCCLTCTFRFFPLKISDGAAEDIRSLVKERYTLLEHLVNPVLLILCRGANLSCFTFNLSVIVMPNNLA